MTEEEKVHNFSDFLLFWLWLQFRTFKCDLSAFCCHTEKLMHTNHELWLKLTCDDKQSSIKCYVTWNTSDIFLYNLFLFSRDSSEDTTQYHRLLDKNVSTKEMLTLIYDQKLSNYPLPGSKTALLCLMSLMSPFGVCGWIAQVSIFSFSSLWNPKFFMVKVTQPWIRWCFHIFVNKKLFSSSELQFFPELWRLKSDSFVKNATDLSFS